ncbi:UNVERIFIED_ORG: hypothetical protein J2W38_005337 [Variovorax paradoxus]|nr:hypothetical protein [Variovorax paradoxus]
MTAREAAWNAIPKIKNHALGDRVYVQAQQIWVTLIAFVEGKKPKTSATRESAVRTITYGDVASLMGFDDRRAGHVISRQLSIVANYCRLSNLPCLNALVVSQATQQPGDEVILTPGNSIKKEQLAVLNHDWFQHRVPTTGTFRQVWEAMQQYGSYEE